MLANITYQILLGLRFLHKLNKIHRDIKPGNILIATDGTAKIGDLGIAKHLGDKDDLRHTTEQSSFLSNRCCTNLNSSFYQLSSAARTFVGTITYMSPERINGDQYNYSSDIWSLALTIMTTALGKPPSPLSDGYWSVLDCHMNDDPLIPKNDDRISPLLMDFLASCLQRDPKCRPSSDMLLQHPFVQKGAFYFDKYNSS